MVQRQPGQIVRETLSRKKKKNHKKKMTGGVAQGIGPEFKLQYCKKEKKNRVGRTNLN
jgi:hypothetical protein